MMKYKKTKFKVYQKDKGEHISMARNFFLADLRHSKFFSFIIYFDFQEKYSLLSLRDRNKNTQNTYKRNGKLEMENFVRINDDM